MTQRLSRQQFVDNLMDLKGAKVLTLVTNTLPKLKSPMNGKVRKIAQVNGMINWIYENAVNRQRIKEGIEPDFIAFPRQWGIRIRGTPFVEHNGKMYLELKREKVLSEEYYNLLGDTITEQIENYLIPSGRSRQGVIKQIVLRDYAIESIESVIYSGQCITLG